MLFRGAEPTVAHVVVLEATKHQHTTPTTANHNNNIIISARSGHNQDQVVYLPGELQDIVVKRVVVLPLPLPLFGAIVLHLLACLAAKRSNAEA